MFQYRLYVRWFWPTTRQPRICQSQKKHHQHSSVHFFSLNIIHNEKQARMTDQVLTTTIKTSYDVLWNLQDAQDVLERVMQLREEILKEQVDPNTDPSEGFLAIQGAALRFHPSKKEEEEDLLINSQKETTNISFEESEETKLNWSVTEESLWAIAALACICVGPAWRSQIHQRRIMIAKDKERRKDGGEGGKSSVSSSPYRSIPLPPSSSASANPQQQPLR